MSLSINSNYSQPSFGSSKFLAKAGNFAKNRIDHIVIQGGVWGILEVFSPMSPDLKHLLIRKLGVDFAEAILKSNEGISAKKEFFNVFAYLADGVKVVQKAFSKKTL